MKKRRGRTKHGRGGQLSIAEETLPPEHRPVATVVPFDGAEMLVENGLRMDKVIWSSVDRPCHSQI